ncbi:hypothetical protein C8R43DRAFT_1057609 [Mycena crocata]|nr:hypothetical protein C8R43DRAFT_1057609 [Mycena crocata]
MIFISSIVQCAAAASSFTMYALNGNGLVNSAKLHHINTAINARGPHSFVLTESKTDSKIGPNLPNNDYTIFEEPGVQADNHHLYKWGVVVGIRKGIQVAQRVKVSSAALKGRVVAIDVVLQTNNGEDFLHRIFGVYAPWDPGVQNTANFWPELGNLVLATKTSWTLGGDLNATVWAAERASGGVEARAQYLAFLARVDGHDIWSNHPERNRNYDWTSRANQDSNSGNIIDRIVASRRCYARIKYPTRMEKHRHDNFRAEMDTQIDATGICDMQVNDDESFLKVYDTFTSILIPTAEKAYGRVSRFTRRSDESIMSPRIEKLIAHLRFIGGAIRAIRDPNAYMSHGAQLAYNRLARDFYRLPSNGQTFLQFATLAKRKLNRQLFSERVDEIKARKEKQDRVRITTALKSGSTKRLVNPSEFIEMPITINDLHSDKLVSDPETVKEISREYWSTLYDHKPPPMIPKPWLTSKSVVAIKQRVQDDPFVWPRLTTLPDFRALLRKGTPRPAPGRDQWEKWLIKSLSDRSLEVVLKLHNYIVMNARFPGDLKDMWLTMFHKRGMRTDLSNWRGLLLSNFLANSPMSWLNFNLVQVLACKRDQEKGFDRLSPQGFYDAIEAYGLPLSIIDLDRAAQTDTECYIRTAHGVTEPITITGVTKQGGSLSPVKSTMTTSLGHHYLNDLMASDPDALVVTSGRALTASGGKVRFGSRSGMFRSNAERERRVRFEQLLNAEPERGFRFGSGSNAFEPAQIS